MLVNIPGGRKPWFHVLPEQYRNNPNVVVLSVKRGAVTRIGTAPDGFRVGLLETKKGVRGLQIIGAGGGYVDHQTIIEDTYKVRMADYVYAGPLSRLPDELLLDDKQALMFLKDRMGEPYLNLQAYLWGASKAGDDDRVN